MERRSFVPESLLTGAESAEVLGSLGNNVIVQDEVDPAGLLCGRMCQLAFGSSVRGWRGRELRRCMKLNMSKDRWKTAQWMRMMMRKLDDSKNGVIWDLPLTGPVALPEASRDGPSQVTSKKLREKVSIGWKGSGNAIRILGLTS